MNANNPEALASRGSERSKDALHDILLLLLFPCPLRWSSAGHWQPAQLASSTQRTSTRQPASRR
eukprot:219662-Pyramimonas_sp.AAC.1